MAEKDFPHAIGKLNDEKRLCEYVLAWNIKHDPDSSGEMFALRSRLNAINEELYILKNGTFSLSGKG